MTYDEVIMLIISCAVIVEIAATFGYLRRIPYSRLLLSSFGASVLGYVFTVIEGFIWTGFFNTMEHLSLMIGILLFALWCIRVFGPRRQESP